MTSFRIAIMGTRGKSSIVRVLHQIFCKNGYKTLSRETGLFPLIYQNDKTILNVREEELPTSRALEIKIIKEKFNFDKYEAVVFENNSIDEIYMKNFNRAVSPDLVIILTISLDHILQQGGTFEEVAETYINSIPEGVPAIFWTNHVYEFRAFKRCAKKKNCKDIEMMYSHFRDRDELVLNSLKKRLNKQKIHFETEKHSPKSKNTGKIPSEIFTKIKGRKLVNIGHINDLVHTTLALNEIMARKNLKKIYLFFNFRSDRLERILIFLNGFLPLYKKVVEGIIVKCDSIGVTPEYLIEVINKKRLKLKQLPKFVCNSVDDFENNIIPQIPRNSTIVLVGNTADDFGYELIKKFGLFRDSYPFLDN